MLKARDYRNINEALSSAFGDGVVVLRKQPKTSPWPFRLDFAEDSFNPDVVSRAKEIVGLYFNTVWDDENRFIW